MADSGWTVSVKAHVQARIRNLKDEDLRERVGHEIEQVRKHPWGTHTGPVRGRDRRGRKVRRISIEEWRVVCVLLPVRREVQVVDFFERKRKSREDYSVTRIRRWIRRSRKNPEPPVGQVLAAHPEWGDTRVARAAGCSASAVWRFRKDAGIPARHPLGWEPWKRS